MSRLLRLRSKLQPPPPRKSFDLTAANGGKKLTSGVEWSFVRSITMDEWRPDHVERMKHGGSRRLFEFRSSIDKLNSVFAYFPFCGVVTFRRSQFYGEPGLKILSSEKIRLGAIPELALPTLFYRVSSVVFVFAIVFCGFQRRKSDGVACA